MITSLSKLLKNVSRVLEALAHDIVDLDHLAAEGLGE